MTNSTFEGEGIRRTKSRKRRWWAVILAPVALAPVFWLVRRSLWPEGVMLDGALNPEFAIYAASLACILGLVLAVLYHRIIDEHEERAFLWGGAVGFYLLGFGGFGWFLLAAAKLVPLSSFLIVWIASILVGGAVQLWYHLR